MRGKIEATIKHKGGENFGNGSVARHILRLALPMTLAQFINVLYNIIDRIYIGRLPDVADHALAGVGITFPIITLVIAFANLAGMGGAPLFSIERGRGNTKKAEEIMGNSFTLLLVFGIVLTLFVLLFKTDILYLFGASDAIFSFADDYITIYMFGSLFVMISLGMNSFINAQGFGKIGMLSVVLGAVLNIILDPLCIFSFLLGVKGAAIASVLSQLASAVCILWFLAHKQSGIMLRRHALKLQLCYVKKILMLGMSGFVMAITNSAVQVVCNASLQQYGGDVYISIMTIINSLREVITLPASGITNAAQPVLGYNYGAHKDERVLKAIRFMSVVVVAYMLLMWLFVYLTPTFFLHIFSSDRVIVKRGIPAIQLYYFGYFMMGFQFSGQSVFVALNKSGQAIFFSLFRKVIIVIPLTLWLPTVGQLGVMGVFLAEPISNFIGGGCSYLTMYLTVYKKLKNDCKAKEEV